MTALTKSAPFRYLKKVLSVFKVKQWQSLDHTSGWWHRILESFTGAWQTNVEIRTESVLANPTVYSCMKLIASDIAKMDLWLTEEDADGIWHETESPSFSPFLRKPNRYQNTQQFIQWWITSKLGHGNTYVLKERDGRGVVTQGHVLDPHRVTPLIAPDGSVFYQLGRDNLAEQDQDNVIVPAREIIHDRMFPLFHPLVGISPLYACALAATHGLSIANSQAKFFANGARPGGIVTIPGAISQAHSDAMKTLWSTAFSGDNAGNVALLADGMTYTPLPFLDAETAQLIEQLEWTDEAICRCFGVPAYMVNVGDPPNYNNVAALNQQYYAQCLQDLITSIQHLLKEGMELPKPFATKFDLDDLLLMDIAAMMKSIADGINAAVLKPNEGRKKINLSPVTGGDDLYLQQQYWALRQLAQRATPTIPDSPQAPQETEAATETAKALKFLAAAVVPADSGPDPGALRLRAEQMGFYAA